MRTRSAREKWVKLDFEEEEEEKRFIHNEPKNLYVCESIVEGIQTHKYQDTIGCMVYTHTHTTGWNPLTNGSLRQIDTSETTLYE